MDAAQTEKMKALALAATGIRTWQERMPEPWRENVCDMNCSPRPKKLDDCPDCISVRRYGDPVAARDAEIADLRAEVERLRAENEALLKGGKLSANWISALEAGYSAPAAGTEKDAAHSQINDYVVAQAQANAVRVFAQAMVDCGIVSSAISTAFLDCAEKCAERIVEAAIAARTKTMEGA